MRALLFLLVYSHLPSYFSCVFLKALQRKKVMIQRDIEKDAFYREALFHDDAKAADSEKARRLGEVLFGFIDQASATFSTEDDAV